LNNSANYTFNFNNSILPNSISSLGFNINGLEGSYYADDDGLGNIRFYTNNSASVKVYTNVSSGTIDYDTGRIIIPDLNITSIVGNDVFGITAVPSSMDIFPVRNQIIDIDINELTVTMLEDTDEFNENYDISSQRVVVSRNTSTTYNGTTASLATGTSQTSITRVYADTPSSGGSSGVSAGGYNGGSSSGSSGGGY